MATDDRSLSDELWRSIADIYDRVLVHPFLTGLTDGTLPEESFRYYIVQDTPPPGVRRVHSIAAGKAAAARPHGALQQDRVRPRPRGADIPHRLLPGVGLSDEDVWSPPLSF